MKTKKQNKVEEVISKIGAFSKASYKQDQLRAEYHKCQRQMWNIMYPEQLAKNDDYDMYQVKGYLKYLNQQEGFIASDELTEFSKSCEIFKKTLGKLESGAEGEEKAFKALDTIRCKKVILTNKAFHKNNHRTELDAIVFTQKAIFIVEVKNTHKEILIDEKGNYCRVKYNNRIIDSNIGVKMNEKDFLLRNALKKAKKERLNIVHIVVFSNSEIKVTNRYQYIQTCYLSDLPHIIENYQGEDIYTEKDFKKFSKEISKNECVQYFAADMDIERFKRNFAVLLIRLQEAKAERQPNVVVEAERKKPSALQRIFYPLTAMFH